MNAIFDDREVSRLRVPPHAVDAEQAVLGSLLISPEALVKVQDWLEADDFYRTDHRVIYAAVLELAQKAKPYDAVTLGEWFESMGLGEQVAGGAYLIELASTQASSANVVAYAEIVKERAELRRLIGIGIEISNAAFSPEGREARQLVADALRDLMMLSSSSRATGPRTMRQIGSVWYAALTERCSGTGKPLGLLTPWTHFNSMTSGLKAGELIVLAGRPSMGKSAWAINAATVNALNGKRVLFFNLEMTGESIFNRAVASVSNTELSWLRDPVEGDESTWARVAEAVSSLRNAPLMVDDTARLTHQQIIGRARREHMRGSVDMVVIDHLHLIPLPGKTRETVEIGHITRDLKALSKELGCPVILLSQLNRSVESRAGSKRPMMSDLRESGNIEQDADLIVFLYRDDYYAAQEGRPSNHPGMVEFIIAKQREGETGSCWALSRLEKGQIADCRDYEAPVLEPRTKAKADRWGSRGKSAAAGDV